MIGLWKSLSEMMRGKPIAAGRVYLRPPHRRDFKAWAALREASRDFLKPWEPTWPADALSRKAFLRRLRAYAMSSHSDAGYTFFVFRAEDRALLGGVSLSQVRRGVCQSGSLGYWIGAPYARQAYTTEALTALLPFVFDSLRLNRIEAACLPSNLASQRLLRKVGFREEGCARQLLRIDGEWRDHLLFGMLSSDPRPALAAVESKKRRRARLPRGRVPAFARPVSARMKTESG